MAETEATPALYRAEGALMQTLDTILWNLGLVRKSKYTQALEDIALLDKELELSQELEDHVYLKTQDGTGLFV